MKKPTLVVQTAKPHHVSYSEEICELLYDSAVKRGTGIARRPPAYITKKIEEGNAVIVLDGHVLAGFCYIEHWSNGRYVANSGLVVSPVYRNSGLARQIKEKIFALSRERYPEAQIFGITTSLAVMKINSGLGFRPVTFSELTTDETFWKGCSSCPNYDILQRNQNKMCLCTGMLYDPKDRHHASKFKQVGIKVLERLKRLRFHVLLKKDKKDAQ